MKYDDLSSSQAYFENVISPELERQRREREKEEDDDNPNTQEINEEDASH